MNPCKNTIEWADFTANPFTGCLHDCNYCYARKMANRMRGMDGSYYRKLYNWFGDPFTPAFIHNKWDKFEIETNAAKSKRIFLGSMSDIGGDWAWKYIARDLSQMDTSAFTVQSSVKVLAEKRKQHTFLMLTKNPIGIRGEWPGNCHMGVSADNNKDAGRRIYKLINNVSAGVRWASLEPLLEAVDPMYLRELDWVVIGAQTGHGAPSPPIDNVREIVAFCAKKQIPIFVKKNIRDKHEGNWPMQFPESKPTID